MDEMAEREREAKEEAKKAERQNRLEAVFLSGRAGENEGTIRDGMDT